MDYGRSTDDEHEYDCLRQRSITRSSLDTVNHSFLRQFRLSRKRQDVFLLFFGTSNAVRDSTRDTRRFDHRLDPAFSAPWWVSLRAEFLMLSETSRFKKSNFQAQSGFRPFIKYLGDNSHRFSQLCELRQEFLLGNYIAMIPKRTRNAKENKIKNRVNCSAFLQWT